MMSYFRAGEGMRGVRMFREDDGEGGNRNVKPSFLILFFVFFS